MGFGTVEHRGRDQGEVAQTYAVHKEPKYAKRPVSEASEACGQTISKSKTSLLSSKAGTMASLLKEQGLGAPAEKMAVATTPKEMAAEKDVAMASGEATNHRDRSKASVGGRSKTSLSSEMRGISRASQARIEQMEREHALQLEVLLANAALERANLKLSLERRMSELAGEFTRRSSRSSKMPEKRSREKFRQFDE
ncbi:hypothetical protein ZHAS_00003299 [Anopheles sinensis]|uniref:Uncharacterized protein n=1 Tax=Anopheles sinensis TaxID=74873 RepID=A0A084WV26_ANOSI|nr:hypothetical protein ZHAS_00003299 [Anopheles sinensis]